MISNYSQTKKVNPDIINGYVLDCTSREPIFWANVHIQDSDESSLTNDNGEFKIISWKGFPVTVNFEHEDFESVHLRVTGIREGLIVMLRRKL